MGARGARGPRLQLWALGAGRGSAAPPGKGGLAVPAAARAAGVGVGGKRGTVREVEAAPVPPKQSWGPAAGGT